MKNVLISLCLLFYFVCFHNSLTEAATVAKDADFNFYIDDAFHFSARVQAGYLTGTANELVYAGSYSETLISKLIWEIDSLYLAGLGCSLQYSFFVFHFDGWFKTADGDGTMDDYDWMIENEEWTDWSHHKDTTITKAGILDINSEIVIPGLSGQKFALSGIAGFKRENFQWQARGGSYIYTSDPDTTFRDLAGNFTPGELGITYEQTYDVPYLGIGFRGVMGPFELAGRLIGSRWAMVEAEDTHHLRDMYTIANMNRGGVFSCDLSVTYNFDQSFAVECGYQHTDYEIMRGNSEYHFANGSIATYRNGEGADLKTSMFIIRLIYSF